MGKNQEFKRNVNEAAVRNLTLENDQYKLNLSQEKAIQMGITENEYQGLIAEISKTNERISSFKEQNSSLKLADPQTAQLLNPSGTLTSHSGEQVGTSFFAPIGTTFVRFNCQGGGAATPGFTCRTKGLSGTWQTKSAIGLIGTVTTIDVPIDASNIYIDITFSTTDSNGGLAQWEVM